MTLGFRTHWPKKMGALAGVPTRFPEKVWMSLMGNNLLKYATYQAWHKEDGILDCNMGNNYDNSTVFYNSNPKKTTIRADQKNRWKGGNLIHPIIGNRTKHRFQFAPTIKCVTTQPIEIKHYTGHIVVFIDSCFFGEVYHRRFYGIYKCNDNINRLAQNDGFDCAEDFFTWFDKDFEGKIIHWTDLLYL